MFRNQYIISPIPLENSPENFLKSEFDEKFIYSHPELESVHSANRNLQVYLLGIAIHPFHPTFTLEYIAKSLCNTCITKEEVFEYVQHLSGRFVLLVKSNEFSLCLGDASNLRGILYGFINDQFVIGSSIELILHSLNIPLKITKEKEKILQDPLFTSRENMWYGDETFDDRLKRVLPNHYLNLKSKKSLRKPLYFKKFKDDKEIIAYVSLILKNTFSALTAKYKVVQPITAGWDSRILLAASKDDSEKIKYYVFDQSKKNVQDVEIPLKLSKRLHLDFHVYQTAPLRKDFIKILKENFLLARKLKKTEHIQFHFDHHAEKGFININGNCSEVARYTYGYSSMKVTFDMIKTFSIYGDHFPYFEMKLKEWYKEADIFSRAHDIYLLDLFYWEQRVGNWLNLWQAEQSIAIEEISPYNNGDLLAALLQVNPKTRRGPDYVFFRRLIDDLWPEVGSEPFNPNNKYLSGLNKKYTLVNYFSKKLKHFIKNFKPDSSTGTPTKKYHS